MFTEKLILKLSLVVRFDKELTKILTVKEKDSIFELSTFFVVGCILSYYYRHYAFNGNETNER